MYQCSRSSSLCEKKVPCADTFKLDNFSKFTFWVQADGFEETYRLDGNLLKVLIKGRRLVKQKRKPDDGRGDRDAQGCFRALVKVIHKAVRAFRGLILNL